MAAKMATYGLTISNAELVLVVLVNVVNATAHDYDRKFRLAMTAIHKMFGHQYVHTAASLKTIMKELSAADGICDTWQAPSPSNLFGNNGTANTTDNVNDRVTKM